MSTFPLSNEEKDILKVLKNEIDYAQNVPSLEASKNTLDASISESESLLRSLGYGNDLSHLEVVTPPSLQRIIKVRSFEELLNNADMQYPQDIQALHCLPAKIQSGLASFRHQKAASANGAVCLGLSSAF